MMADETPSSPTKKLAESASAPVTLQNSLHALNISPQHELQEEMQAEANGIFAAVAKEERESESVMKTPRARPDTTRLWRKLKTACMVMSMYSYISEKHRVLELFKQGDALAELEEGEEAHIAQQGNPEFYTVDNIKKRRAIKQEPEIQSRIRELWDVLDMRKNEQGDLTKESFILLMVRLYYLMVPPPVNLDKALVSADEDWQNDSGGATTMNFEKFVDSIFELVDVWTEKIDMREYCDLLDRIIDGVTKFDDSMEGIELGVQQQQQGLADASGTLRSTRSRVFKSLDEIRFDASFSMVDGDDPGGEGGKGWGNDQGSAMSPLKVDGFVEDGDDGLDSDEECFDDDAQLGVSLNNMSVYNQSFHSLRNAEVRTRSQQNSPVSSPDKTQSSAADMLGADVRLNGGTVGDKVPLPVGQLLNAAGPEEEAVLVGDGIIVGAGGQLAAELAENASPLRAGSRPGGLGALDLGQAGLEKRAQKAVGLKMWHKLREATRASNYVYKRVEARSTNLTMFTSSNNMKRKVIMKPDKVMHTIAKIYDAKIRSDSVRAAQQGNGRGSQKLMKKAKGGRFDTYVLKWHLQQYGTRRMAQRKLRLLLSSVKRLARFHPRIEVFARMVGCPVEEEPGVDRVDPRFEPRAASQYLLPLLRCFLSTERSGRQEKLEKWYGIKFEPKLVPKQEFLAAAEKSWKYIPSNAPQLGLLGVGAATSHLKKLDQTQLSAVVLLHNPDPSLLFTVMKFYLELGHITVDEKGHELLQGLIQGQPTSRKSVPSTPKAIQMGTGHERKKKEYVDVDKALVLLLDLWDGEEEWKQTIVTLSAILMIQRWTRKVREKVQERRSEVVSNGESKSRPSKQLDEARLIDQTINSETVA